MTPEPLNDFEFLRQHLKSRLSDHVLEPPAQSSRRHAAVAVVLRQRLEDAELLIIKRAVSEKDHWSGHLALPGGRWEAGDANLWQTAARETFEEVGVPLLSGGEFLGKLPVITPRSPLAPQITVAPFVSIAPLEYHIKAQGEESRALTLSDEVQMAFWMPVQFLRERGRSDIFRLMINDEQREWAAYPSEQGPIWGLTERILTSFLETLE